MEKQWNQLFEWLSNELEYGNTINTAILLKTQQMMLHLEHPDNIPSPGERNIAKKSKRENVFLPWQALAGIFACARAKEVLKDRDDISFEYKLGFDAAVGFIQHKIDLLVD
jgi:hypothetical protein